ncbi:cell division protein FtsL [Desulfogranum marinum]|uniref:cell division protein FtsL n=1 Tax=Desulfogranum marinum TaxID=453220 RepID=UPI001965B351|nr:cell division protein FtsL [Desulfogranum marinum]MBM9511077.1 cell division protein FtsL [Desulfogranum marinum]
MITNVSVRPYRPGTVCTTSVARRKVRRKPLAISPLKHLQRPLAVILIAAVVLVAGVSQLFSWQIQRAQKTLQQVQQQRKVLDDSHMILLAKRAQLTSESHIQALAGARLELYVPSQGQVHKM